MSGVAFLFPGQGSQAPGMGQALSEAYPESREVFASADAALGTPLSRTCFAGTEDELALTETTQPAILTVSVAALRALTARGVRAVAAAGHSLGEYSAHVAAGTLSFDDAVRTVRLRGRFMQEAVPAGEGAMAAVLGLDAPALDEVCAAAAEGQVVAPANFNAPGQIVVAGHRAAVERAGEGASARGARKVVPLPVSAPFHCSLMQPAAERLSSVLDEIVWSDPAFPVYGNADAAAVRAGAAAREALLRQVTAPVRWQQLVERMLADGIRTFVELGPGRVLAGLLRRIDRGARVYGVADPEGVERAASELAAERGGNRGGDDA